MASIRKKISTALGLNSQASSSSSKASSMDLSRSSIDSGYHSMIAKSKPGSQDSISQATIFVASGTESSPERSSKKLHKAISSTFSGAIQAFSNTVRSTTSYIYPTTGEPELPSSEWAECETPKKESRRSSIMSSVRSRKQRLTPRASGTGTESLEVPQSPAPVKQDKSPALDVEIPNPSLSYESLGRVSVSDGSQLLAGVKLPAGSRNLWPGPTRLTFDQASGNDRREIPRTLETDDPYVEQGDALPHGLSFITSSSEFVLESPPPKINKRCVSDDKGYLSEVESNADISESDELSPACLKYVAAGPSEARTSSPCHHQDPAASHVHVVSSASTGRSAISSQMKSVPSRSEPSKVETFDGSTEHIVSLEPPNWRSNLHNQSVGDGLDGSFHPDGDAITRKPRSLLKRLSTGSHGADAESLESNMGSRAAWERHRADRERRYMAIVDMAPSTDSDDEVGTELDLKRSPQDKIVHYAEELVQGKANSGRSGSIFGYPTGDLRYAVEAIERPAFPVGDLAYAVEAIERPAFPVGDLAYAVEAIERSAFPVGDLAYAVEAIERSAFPVGDLAYAVEAIDRPSVTTFDPLETVFQQRPMLRLSDSVDEPRTLQASDPPEVSPLCEEVPSSSLADSTSSRVELPSSSESFSAEFAPECTKMTMKLTDEGLMTSEAGNPEGQSIRQLSSKLSDVSAKLSPEHQSCTASEDVYEAGLKAGGLFIPTYLSSSSRTNLIGEDAYEAGLRAAGVSPTTYSSNVTQQTLLMDTVNEGDLNASPISSSASQDESHGTYREKLETGLGLPKQRSRNRSPFEHSRTVPAFSDDVDDTGAATICGLSSNVPSPFPNLHVRAGPASHIRSPPDTLATHGKEQIGSAGSANVGVSPSPPSPSDELQEQVNESVLKPFSPTGLESADLPETHTKLMSLGQHDLQSPLSGTTGSVQSRSNSNTPQETFNTAKLPSFVSPSLNGSRKSRRRKKQSSSGTETSPFADDTMHATNVTLGPDLSPPKLELNKSSTLGRTQPSLSGRARIAQGSMQKPTPNRQVGRSNRRGRDQASLEGYADVEGPGVRRSDPSSKPKSRRKSPSSKGHKSATMFMTSSHPRINIPQGRGEKPTGEIRENAEGSLQDSKPRSEPDLSITHFDSASDILSLYASGKLGDISYAGHELDNGRQANPSENPSLHLDEDLQQKNDKKAAHFASGEETNGNDIESQVDAPGSPGQKTNSKPPLEAEKRLAVQKELARKSDRACSRLVGKLNNKALGHDHVHEDDSTHRDGRPPWRP